MHRMTRRYDSGYLGVRQVRQEVNRHGGFKLNLVPLLKCAQFPQFPSVLFSTLYNGYNVRIQCQGSPLKALEY
jgi:hypothetical protein